MTMLANNHLSDGVNLSNLPHFNRDYNPLTGRYVQSDPIGVDGGINLYGYTANNTLILTDEKGKAYRLHGDSGHGDLSVQSGLTVEAFILDLPTNALNNYQYGYTGYHIVCNTITTNEGLGTVCAGVGNPPSTVGGLDFAHGDLDFIRVKGQWYKIASEWFVKRDGASVDFEKTGGNWKGFVLEADSWFIKYGFYGMRGKNPSTSINYINRIKREVYPWMPGI